MDIPMPIIMVTTMARGPLMLNPRLLLKLSQRLRLMLTMDTMDIPLLMPTMDTTDIILDMPTTDTMDILMPMLVTTMARGLLMLSPMPDTFMDTTAMDTDTMDMDMPTMVTTDILMPTMDTMDTIIKLVLSRIEDLPTVKLVEYLVTMAI